MDLSKSFLYIVLSLDVADAVHQSHLLDDDLRHQLQLRIHAAGRHGTQRHCLQPLHHENIRSVTGVGIFKQFMGG